MRNHRVSIPAVLCLFSLQANPASALNDRSYVTGTNLGAPANPCTRSQPCQTFAQALAQTNAGGEINCIDPGEYGKVAINKSITINCEAARGGITLATNGFGIELTTAATDVVIIRGVDLLAVNLNQGQGLICNSCNIRELHISNVTVRGFNKGMTFQPVNISQLVVEGSTFANNSVSGIIVLPSSPGAANVHLSRVRADNNADGITVTGSSSSIGINVNIQDSLITGNTLVGVRASSNAGQAPVNISITGSQISGNFGPGLQATGSGISNIRVGASMISANASAINAQNNGQVRSFGNNQVNSNGGGETFTGADLLK